MAVKKKRVKKQTAASIGNGWLSTDEEEIERRRLRSIEESLSVRRIRNGTLKNETIFGDYLVSSADDSRSGFQYTVEYRDKQQRINTCSCPDYQVNGLATCKHIERVSRFLLRKKTPQKRTCTELFLNRDRCSASNEPVIEVLWADNLRANSKIKKVLMPYFSTDNTLLVPTLDAYRTLEKHVYQASLRSDQIKLSAHIIPWLEYKEQRTQASIKRSVYLNDVNEGKRVRHIVNHPLYDYQTEGMLHLAFKGRAILADEMGLGKTVQAIAACELLRQLNGIERVLVVSPVSLKTEWEEQINKFTHLPNLIVQGNRAERLKSYQKPSFFYLCNYEQLLYDADDIQNALMPDVIILDEAQRIKNWQTKTAQVVKRLKSPKLFVLTGTPLENRIDEIYSIAQVVDPHLLGPLFRFNRDFYQLDEKGKPTGYKNLDKLHHRLLPILLRRRKHDVEDELPDRINNTYFVSMHKEQFLRYDEYKTKLARLVHKARTRPLSPDEYKRMQMYLACMRMLCDTPYILDQTCRISPKLDELKNILPEQLEDPENKIIIFSEWTKMLDLIREYLDSQGVEYAWHTGQVPQKKRRGEINRFKNDPNCRLFLSSDAGATGLNLQVANIVINVDLPWNPAKLEQRIARAWRKHQKRQVNVINLVCEDSIEHRIMSILAQKSALAKGVIDGDGEPDMDLPSGRKVMIERLEQMMGTQSSFVADIENKKNSQDAFAADSLPEEKASHADTMDELYHEIEAKHPDSLTHLSVFENQEGQDTVFSVVQGDAKEQSQMFHEIANGQDSKNIEVIDADTMATIQRLVDAGILSFNTAKETLLSSEDNEQHIQKQRQNWINNALKRFVDVERQFKMSELLFNGGFKQEALTPSIKALELSVSCLYQAISGKVEEKIELSIIQEQLIPQFELSSELLTILASLREGSDIYQNEALKLLKQLSEMVDEQLLGRLLP
ncbi:MAG: DEAD/DEAH box helicase [Gammaproteobacteria bacterium]|nr:DEAD/DEAH box helicase [Gammaproteobacteria bacterium]